MSDADDLRALMEADRWIERVNGQRSHLPELTELSEVEAELRGLLKNLHDEESALAPLKAEFDTAEAEALRVTDRAKDLDTKLSASTANARELAAIQTELDHVRTLQRQHEDKELDLMEQLEPRNASIDDIKRKAQPLMARRTELMTSIAALQASLDEELANLRSGRPDVANALAPDLLKRYETAFHRSGTSGAANVIEGRCDGCRLSLSPLDRDRWKATPEGSFIDCPECGRVLLP